ncbi:MAG: hypothetical protein ACTSRZ_11945 [Promethearchaeota archaeon]
MRIRNRKKIARYYVKLTCISLIPFLIFGSYLGGVMYLINDMTSFLYEIDTDPIRDGFYPIENINTTILREMANNFSLREELYHIPINLSQAVSFDAETGEIIKYHPTDNGALFTGYALAAECLRYATLSDGSIEKEQSLNLTRKLVSGMAKLLEVPNGGLGPEYPGQTLARFYAPPELKDDENFTWIFKPHYKHFNGTGKYSDWRCRLYTSKDELGGYFLGIAMALKFIDNFEIQNTIKLIIGQLANGFLNSYWQEIHGDGTPDGAHLQPPSMPQWKLLLMKMASIAYPDIPKYKQLYYYYATKELGIIKACSLGPEDSINNYYGLPFGHNVLFALILLEENQLYRDIYIRNYEKSYEAFKGQRNAYFNAIYLAFAKLRNTQPQYNISKIKWDVLDQLWRFNVFGLYPFDDRYGGRNKSIAREELAISDSSWLKLEPRQQKLLSSPLSDLYSWLWEGDSAFMPHLMDTRYLRPATVEMFPIASFIWGDNPFTEMGGHERSSDKRIYEQPGVSFTLPYWILAYFDYI